MKNTKAARTVRLFIPACNSIGQVIDLSDDLMHYCSRVVRLLDEASIIIWNGRNCQFDARLNYVSKKLAQVTVIGGPVKLDHKELKLPIHIFQALPEGDKIDWVLEKCTEMGAMAFYPIQAARSVTKLQGDRAEKRHAHWQRVVTSACLQSERGALPAVHPCASLRESLSAWRGAYPKAPLLFFDPQAKNHLKGYIQKISQETLSDPIAICVGPEGGWSEDELAIAQEHGANLINFSPRVLRTETFALACLSQLVALLDLESEQTS